MDTVNSFKGYGKVDEVEQAAFKRKTRKRLIILSISVVLLLSLVIGIVAGTLAHRSKSSGEVPASQTSPAEAIRSICSATQYQDSCYSSLSSANTTDPLKIFRFSLAVAMDSLKSAADLPNRFVGRTEDPFVREALNVCGSVLSDAVETLNDTVVSGGDVDDLKTWLSTVVTDQETCLDSLVEANATFVEDVGDVLRNSSEFASNSLAIVSRVISAMDKFKKIDPKTNNRRLLSSEGDDFPAWFTASDRRLLQQSNPKPDVTVAADGSGDVKTISEAVARIPKKSKTRFVIYVKKGTYSENVVIDKSRTNVMIYGDGKDATVVTGDKNFVDGTPTFATATFAVVGSGFIARDMGFKNTAGPQKHQAVAFRSGADQSVYFSCSFDAYQDTLYAHSNRQFYRNCDVTGTIDFIFGNSAAVFQSCNIRPRQPMANQFNTITAQGKKDPNQNTGISIQRCALSPLDKLTAPTYLGRPWKAYSTTVVMQSDVGGFLNPLGWTPWVANVDPPSTIFYGEYQNTGPGSGTAGRVKWAGFRPVMTPAQAKQFNVQSFIQGPDWLPATKVVFDST